MLLLPRNFSKFFLVVFSALSLFTDLHGAKNTSFSVFARGEKISFDLPFDTSHLPASYCFSFWKENSDNMYVVDAEVATKGDTTKILNDLLKDSTYPDGYRNAKLLSSNLGIWNGFPTLDVSTSGKGGFCSKRYILTPKILYTLEAIHNSEEGFEFSEFELLQNQLPVIHTANKNKPNVKVNVEGKLYTHELPICEDYSIDYYITDGNNNFYDISCNTFFDVEDPKGTFDEYINEYKKYNDESNLYYNIEKINGYWTLNIKLLESYGVKIKHVLLTKRQTIEISTNTHDWNDTIHEKIVKSIKIH